VLRKYSTREARTTKKPGFQFVPVRLDASELPTFAINRVLLDFSTHPDGPNGGELLRLLHAIVGQPLSPEAAHFSGASPTARFNRNCVKGSSLLFFSGSGRNAM
jgi:hypothetical protein